MEYDHEIENLYLSVINDRDAYGYAVQLLHGIKNGKFSKLGRNENIPLNRNCPDLSALSHLASKATVYNTYATLRDSTASVDRLRTAWLKIADYIDPDFIQLDRPEPKVEVIDSITKLGEAYQKTRTPLFDQTKLDELQTEINQHMADAASYFVKVENSLNQTKETNMPIINNVTYFKGTNIKTLDEDQLIKAIKDLESEVESLKSIKVTSKKITSNIEEITEAINLVVAELDSRTK